jgi:uncharacterized protein
MEYLIIAFTAMFASALTLFSGFGLGTILLPVLAIFFPVEIAISLTAVVHLLNNIFKLGLMRKHVDLKTALKFGVPAAAAAFAGAYLLMLLSDIEPIVYYHIGSKIFYIELIKIVIAALIIIFALFELIPKFQKISFEKKYLPLGGFISGFFGGLSGHQGALRSAFLIKMELSKETFIATGIVIACFIDVSRLFVYSTGFLIKDISENTLLLIITALAAFIGAFFGKLFLKKITYKSIQIIVGVMLLFIAAGLGLGIF